MTIGKYFILTFSFILLVTGNTVLANTEVTKVTENIYAYAPGDDYVSMFIVTGEGVIAIEPANTRHATGMLKAIKNVTDQPVKYLFQSHNHWDHANGGKVFQDAGATIIAHEEAAKWMKANPHSDLTLPSETWNGFRHDIELGETTLELHYLGLNHGLGMTVFLLPKEKVAYIADLATPNRVLFSIVPDFNIKEWLRSLEEIEKLNFDKAVFSHTHADSSVGSKQDVVNTRQFILDLQAAVIAEFQKGTSFDKIPITVKLPKYEKWVGYNEWLPMNVLRIALDMWMGPYPWHPTPEK